MYIRFRTNNNRVIAVCITKPINVEDREFKDLNGSFAVAEYNGGLPKHDYLIVVNPREETETWTEPKIVEKEVKKIVPKVVKNAEPIFDENGEIIDYKIFEKTIEEEITEIVQETIEEEKSRTYLTCELVANFRSYTEEELQTQKIKQYNMRVTQLVRLKYDANAVEALLANYADDQEKYQAEFDAFTTYRKECKVQAKAEIYGD